MYCDVISDICLLARPLLNLILRAYTNLVAWYLEEEKKKKKIADERFRLREQDLQAASDRKALQVIIKHHKEQVLSK